MAFKPPEGLISDEVFSLPAEYMQTSSGLALDIGSTIGKIIYRSNKEYQEGQPKTPQDEAGRGSTHFAMFPRSDVKGMIDFIKENCDLKADEDGEIVVNSSGMGGAAFRTEFEAALNCKMNIVSEFDCFCKAFLAMEKVLSPEEMFIPHSAAAEADAKHQASTVPDLQAVQSMGETRFMSSQDVDETEDRPRLLVIGGSGTMIFQINSDGTFALIDGMYVSGLSMYGLSSMLTQETDFGRLAEMAGEGDGRSVDVWVSDVMGRRHSAPPPDNVYDKALRHNDRLLYPFGKGVNGKTEDKRIGDLVWSVFNATATAHAQQVYAAVKLTHAKDVYLGGNLFNSEIIRNMILRMKTHLCLFLPSKYSHGYHFLRGGGMYGALGAFLATGNHTDQS